MDSIISKLDQQEVWEQFLAYRLMKGRFTWHEFEEADAFVSLESYLPMAQHLAKGGHLSIPTKKIINKMGTGKKRVVYCYAPDEMVMLKLIAYLLYKYDDCFAPNCYAFRRGLRPHDAILQLNKVLKGRSLWAYKLDIHDYFNSIPIEILLPILKETLSDDSPLYDLFERMLTDNHVISDGSIIEEPHGVMAGTPTSPFLADIYLKEVDRHFYDAQVTYARYSDDIILFAPDQETLEKQKATLLGFLEKYRLEVNPTKERIFSPDEPYEFLGFRCHGKEIDISKATIQKMKGKIKRKAHALIRWRERKNLDAERAMKAMIRHFNRKFFESDETDTLNWSRWYFPIINRTDGLKEIDHYLQQNIRFLGTGRHTKANFRTSYEQLKKMGYRSLVNEFHLYKNH